MSYIVSKALPVTPVRTCFTSRNINAGSRYLPDYRSNLPYQSTRVLMITLAAAERVTMSWSRARIDYKASLYQTCNHMRRSGHCCQGRKSSSFPKDTLSSDHHRRPWMLNASISSLFLSSTATSSTSHRFQAMGVTPPRLHCHHRYSRLLVNVLRWCITRISIREH